MTPDKITLADILQAAKLDDLDAACSFVQERADIATGDVASHFFSGDLFAGWREMQEHTRFGHLCDYLRTEALWATGSAR